MHVAQLILRWIMSGHVDGVALPRGDWTAENWTVTFCGLAVLSFPAPGGCSEVCGPYQEPERSLGTENPLGLLK